MLRKFLILIIPILISNSIRAQEFKSEIILSSGIVSDIIPFRLSKTLSGISGLINYNNLLIAHNDHYNSNLYILDSNANIIDSIITNLDIKDLEDITQDEDYIYLGDFGNNARGDRRDLRIYRIHKSSISKKLKIDTISFSYSKQKDFTPSQYSNWTDFDCEAMISLDSHIVLFTKEWYSYGTSIYFLPKHPGNHVAEYKGSLNMIGLITGASYIKDKNELFLVGYSNILIPFILRIYDIKNNDFTSGKISKYSLPLPAHQVEAITHIDGYRFYIGNEYFTKLFLTINQKLHLVNLEDLINIDIEY